MDRAEPISVFLMKEGMWIILLFTIGFLALAVILLGIRVFFVKGGHFPSPHISDNKYLRKKGITCSVSTDAREREKKTV